MQRLTGEYECKVDTKGRLRMPSALVRQFNSENLTFTVNRGFEKNLILYPKEVWLKKADEIDRLSMYRTKERQVLRYFYRGATDVSLDSSDRILLPKTLMGYAGIENEVMLFALQEQVEIWSKEEYEKMIAQEPEEFSFMADEIFSRAEKNE